MKTNEKRIKNLEERTNKFARRLEVFVSLEDYSLIRDYYKSLLDDNNVKPKDLQKMFNQIDKIKAECDKKSSLSRREKTAMLKEKIPLATEVLSYRYTLKLCEEFPDGNLIPKSSAANILHNVKLAKAYFKEKNET